MKPIKGRKMQLSLTSPANTEAKLQLLCKIPIANSNLYDGRTHVRAGTESPLRASKMTDFSAIWWPILKTFEDKMGDHSTH